MPRSESFHDWQMTWKEVDMKRGWKEKVLFRVWKTKVKENLNWRGVWGGRREQPMEGGEAEYLWWWIERRKRRIWHDCFDRKEVVNTVPCSGHEMTPGQEQLCGLPEVKGARAVTHGPVVCFPVGCLESAEYLHDLMRATTQHLCFFSHSKCIVNYIDLLYTPIPVWSFILKMKEVSHILVYILSSLHPSLIWRRLPVRFFS